MQLAVFGDRLEIFSTSQERAARHLTLDIRTGSSLVSKDISVDRVRGGGTDGRPIEDGYYEVEFPATKARFVRLTALSEINGRGWASAAELQIAGAKGWGIKASGFEPNSRMTTVPENLLDGDRDSWWHSQWLDGIPPHPHTLTIDLGQEQVVKGLRYLPAVINNNNGMIKDYELAVSADGENWGDPVAEGIMVNRGRIHRAMFAGRTVFFETIDSGNHRHQVCRYNLDGKAAEIVLPDGRLESVAGRYLIATAEHHGGSPHLIVFDGDDPSYQYKVGTLKEDLAGVRYNDATVEGNKLLMASGRIAIADLTRKVMAYKPSDPNLPQNKNGILVRAEHGVIAKISHQGNNEHALTIIDSQSATISESALTDSNEPTQPIRRGRYHGGGELTSFGRVILPNDNASISAWISQPDRDRSPPLSE